MEIVSLLEGLNDILESQIGNVDRLMRIPYPSYWDDDFDSLTMHTILGSFKSTIYTEFRLFLSINHHAIQTASGRAVSNQASQPPLQVVESLWNRLLGFTLNQILVVSSMYMTQTSALSFWLFEIILIARLHSPTVVLVIQHVARRILIIPYGYLSGRVPSQEANHYIPG